MAKWSGRETIAEFFSSIFLLLRRTVPIPRWCSGKEKRIGRRIEGGRERESFDLASIRRGKQRTVDRLPEANGSTLRGNGQMVWKLLDCTSSRIEIPLCIFPHVRFPLVSELATNRRMENPASQAGLRQLRSDLRFLLSAKCNLEPGKVASTSRISPSSSRLIGSSSVRIRRLYSPLFVAPP